MAHGIVPRKLNEDQIMLVSIGNGHLESTHHGILAEMHSLPRQKL